MVVGIGAWLEYILKCLKGLETVYSALLLLESTGDEVWTEGAVVCQAVLKGHYTPSLFTSGKTLFFSLSGKALFSLTSAMSNLRNCVAVTSIMWTGLLSTRDHFGLPMNGKAVPKVNKLLKEQGKISQSKLNFYIWFLLLCPQNCGLTWTSSSEVSILGSFNNQWFWLPC